MATLSEILSTWSRRHGLRPVVFGTTCCAAEVTAAMGPRFDDGRSGLLSPVSDPGHADLLIVAGRPSLKAAPLLRQVYEAMAAPRWVMAFGACAASGGLFDTYAVAPGADEVLPGTVHVHVPGCPPHPLDLLDALESLRQRMQAPAAG